MKKTKISRITSLFLILCSLVGLMSCLTIKKNHEIFGRSDSKKGKQEYSTYDSFKSLVAATDAKYPVPLRVTSPGTKENPMYHGFYFYNCSPLDMSQFDPSGRYMVDMRISIEGREVTPTDKGDIGIIDLRNNFKWTKIGETTAWNWQQGCRMEWIPGSSTEVVWDDRSEDKKSYVSHIYDTQTKKTRTLALPIYTISPDGNTALTHDFERMKHGGTNFVGLEDKYKDEWAPKETGIWKMNLKTGKAEKIITVNQMAHILYPKGLPSDTVGGCLYIFREGYNPSGKRFIAFIKDERKNATGAITTHTTGFSMTSNGEDIRFLYDEPSHHYWIDDETILDNVKTKAPGDVKSVQGYFVFKDDGSGTAKEMLWAAPNGHDSFHPDGNWILTDTYYLDGYQYLYMYHIPTKKFIALGKFKSKSNTGIFRLDLHPRFSPDGNFLAIDSNHEGLGRQMYLIDIRYILKNPPVKD